MAETARRRRPAAVRDEKAAKAAKAAEARREASGREARRRASARPSREDSPSEASEMAERIDLLSKRLHELEWRLNPSPPFNTGAGVIPPFPTVAIPGQPGMFSYSGPPAGASVYGVIRSNNEADTADTADANDSGGVIAYDVGNGKRSSPVIETFNELERRIDALHQQISELQARLEPALTDKLTDAPEPDGNDTSPWRLGGSYLADRLSNTVEVVEAAISRLAGLERALEL